VGKGTTLKSAGWREVGVRRYGGGGKNADNSGEGR